jgi:hypothetical protein
LVLGMKKHDGYRIINCSTFYFGKCLRLIL